jgi:hypothetical protein
MDPKRSSAPVDGRCEKCQFLLSEHGASTGKCHGHAKVRDEAGKWVGTWRPCRNAPIDGATVCGAHGGKAGQVRRAAAQTVALDRAVRRLKLGGRVVVDPAEAMLEQVYEAQANVVLYRFLVEQLGLGVDAVGAVVDDEGREVGIGDIDRSELGGTVAGRVDPANWKAAPHVFVVMYNDERRWLVQCAKACRDAGVEDARVVLATRMATQLVEVNTAVVEGLLLAVGRLLDQGSLTADSLVGLRRSLVPGLLRKAIEGRVVGETVAS